MSTPILVDTSYWIEFFNRSESEYAGRVRELVRGDLAAITGVVLSELLQGTRTEKEYRELGSALTATTWIETSREVYARAGELGFGLRRRGMTVPVTDCVIAAAAESIGAGILTLDQHFAHLAREADVEIEKS
jgi:predicted nucleic acid-binding protein